MAAVGNSKAMLIKTQSQADAQIVTAEACRIRARGNNKAATTSERSTGALEHARLGFFAIII